MSTDKTVSVEQLFPNVDAWGAAEWFERLVTAIQRQDECVLKKDDAGFEISRMIAASSAMRIARDYAEEIRAALAAPQPADVPHDDVWTLEEVTNYCGFDGPVHDAGMCPICNPASVQPLATPAPSTSTEEALRAENARLVEAALDRIETLAFDIPPPNQWTPKIVETVMAARTALSALSR